LEKIFLVDKYTVFGIELFKHLIQSSKGKVKFSFIGPQDENFGFLSQKGVNGIKKVWRFGHYVNSILQETKKEKPSIIHFSFDTKTFGPLKSSLKFPLLLLLLKNRTTCSVITTIHSVLVVKDNARWDLPDYLLPSVPNIFLKIFWKIFIKIICNLNDKIIVLNEISKRALIEYFGINEKKIEVILLPYLSKSNPQDIEKFEFKEKIKNKKIIIYFGVISPRKGQEQAIRIFHLIENKIPDSLLLIVGKASEGFQSYEKKIKELVNELKLEEKVIFTGFQDDKIVDLLFQKSEIALYLYKPIPIASAALGLAIKNKTPIIATNSENFKEVLNDSAVYVNLEDSNDISEKILDLINDSEKKATMRLGMDEILKKYSYEKCADKHLSLYESLFKKHDTK